MEAEGGFGTGAVKREVAAFAWSALENLRDIWCGADLQICMSGQVCRTSYKKGGTAERFALCMRDHGEGVFWFPVKLIYN